MLSWLTKFKNTPKGLVLPEFKSLSNHSGHIQTLPIYEKYYVGLLQRDGEYAIPTISIGDIVNAGDIIARPTSHLALHRHAPTSGEITGIIDIVESHPSAMTIKAIEITADGNDTQTTDFPAIRDFYTSDRQLLLERIFRAGIAGMGGAGFPTEKKINLENPVDTLIINGAECEPYITCDDLLMRHYAMEIITGAQIFARIIGAKHILIGIEDNKPEALQIMQRSSAELVVNDSNAVPVHVRALPTQYPMGSRHQIAHYLMGSKPNINRRSYQSGFICHNVATAKATFDAVVQGRPLTERLVTFSGDGIKNPGVYNTKIGSNTADVFTDVGLDNNSEEIIFGGTMMGFAIDTANEKPIVIKRETTSVLAFMTPPELSQKPEQNCIRCGHCADACPMDLLPQQLQFYGRTNKHEKAEEERLFDCIECGLCTYVCPSDIPLVQIFQHSKGEIINERHKKTASEHARIRFETRNQRIETAKRERAKKSAARRAKLKATAPRQAIVSKTAETSVDKSTNQLKTDQLKTNQLKNTSAVRTKQPSKPTNEGSDRTSTATLSDVTQAATTQQSARQTAPRDKQDLIAAALARSQAKKAARLAKSQSRKDIEESSS